jgi:hypothetical protein
MLQTSVFVGTPREGFGHERFGKARTLRTGLPNPSFKRTR